MTYSRTRSVPGTLYALDNNTAVYRHPSDVYYQDRPKPITLHSGDTVLVVCNEQDIETMDWSLVLYVEGTTEHPAPKCGWVKNDKLRWLGV